MSRTVAAGPSTTAETARSAVELWVTKVQPLFDTQCVKCHGPIEQKSGLELDTPEAVLKGGEEGPAIVPGKPEESRLYQFLAADSDPHMPPKKQLSDVERETVRAWIAAMAVTEPPPESAKAAVPEFAGVTEAIDGLLAAAWARQKVTPAPALEDRAWCRRVYLDLAGRIPTGAELETFLNDARPDKRRELVDRLLASTEFPVRMREIWDALLMGRTKRDRQEDRRKQNGWWAFLEKNFAENRPWDELVREILAGRPNRPEDKGASWFLYERRNEHQAIAEAVAPVVYGTRIDCAQCHDHPLAREIKQAHYWGLVAAYNRSKNVDGGSSVGESAVGGFINFTNLKKESQPAKVVLLTGKTLDEVWPAGDGKETDSDENYLDPKEKVRVPKQSRRAAFADAATRDNPLLARAFVNRAWAALLGRGLVHPVDEMNARNAPSHPELLDWLAEDFAKHRHDVRRLWRGIALSRAYGLGHGAVAPETFAGALERPLMAEQLARSWRVALGFPPEDEALRRAVTAAMPDVMPREYNATFQQAQFLAYSPLMTSLLQPVAGGILERMGAAASPAERAEMAFLAVYGRKPDEVELTQARAFLEGRSSPEDQGEAKADAAMAGARDLLWALLTSAEFLATP